MPDGTEGMVGGFSGYRKVHPMQCWTDIIIEPQGDY